MSFSKWFKKNLGDYAKDISRYGADQGYPHITYYADTNKIYAKFKDEIWLEMENQTREFGAKNTMELIASFGRKDMVENYLNTGKMDDQAKCLLVWFMCDNEAHKYCRQQLLRALGRGLFYVYFLKILAGQSPWRTKTYL